MSPGSHGSARRRARSAARRAAAALAALLACGCAPAREDPAAAARAAYLRNDLLAADSAFARALAARPRDAELRAWRAETLRRLGRLDEAEAEARAALAAAPGLAFAHTVLGNCFDPLLSDGPRASRDSCLAHLEAAVRADAREAEAWLALWKYAAAGGDTAREREAMRRVDEAGYFSGPALAYGQWQLETLPEGAVLVTNGDLDTYPPRLLQLVRGVRADVAVVNASLLHWHEYARAVAAATGLPLAPHAAGRGPTGGEGGAAEARGNEVLRGWRELARRGGLARPLAIAVTVPPEAAGDPADPRLRLCGPYWIVAADTSGAAADAERFRRAVFSIEPESFAAPLVTERDRSPVRRATGGSLAHNLIAATFAWGQRALAAGDAEGARMAAERIEALARRLPHAPDVSEHVRLLRAGRP